MPRISRNQRIKRMTDRVSSMVSELEDIRSELWDLLPRKKLPVLPSAYIKLLNEATHRFAEAAASDILTGSQHTAKLGQSLRIRLPNNYKVNTK